MASAAGSRRLSAAPITPSSRQISSYRSGPSEEVTISSTESYTTLSDHSSDDDEIVYSISDLSVISAPQVSAYEGISDDDDFVLLSRSGSPVGMQSVPSEFTSLSASMLESQTGTSSADGLSDSFAHLQMEDSAADLVRPVSQATTRRRMPARGSSASVPAQSPPSTPSKPTKHKKAATSATPTPQSTPTKTKKTKKRRARAKAKKAASTPAQSAKATGVGKARALGSAPAAGASTAESVSFYQDAVQYISTFLSTPSPKPKGNSDLAFLHALIIELGLCPATSSAASEQSFSNLPSLPRSLRAAKALLKSRVFMNVRDYLDVRHKGLEALQGIMLPNRKALIKDLSRGKGKRRVERGFVKDSGLGVLLVACYR